MKNLASTPIGQIVAENYQAAQVFTAHNMDFCCGGGITLAKACQKHNTDLNQIRHELESVIMDKSHINFEHETPDQLINTIVNVHHHYIKTTVPTLQLYLDKLCRVHGERHPELWQIKDLFDEGATALLAHLQKEELVLFPFINAMVASKKDGFELSPPHFGHIENPIQMMEHEHSAEGERFRKINELTNNYECPADGCQTYKVTYAMLKEFEADLHKHIHLENNVLFPQARLVYKEFNF
ncbi:MAG: iron-sulfur cluster repair di-iron protein [Fulvivirga sp.]|uniref:iron-sulfur cluster repair di-iron protein n=1 Tax=Fulvivirga sp. TaxID=1931237 RepID=UPI0032EBD2A1